MSNRATILKKQALERWKYVPPAQQKELIEELRAWPRGQAVIELGEPARAWPDNYTKVHGIVVNIAFGINIDPGTTKRYLMLSDLPPLPEESESKDPE